MTQVWNNPQNHNNKDDNDSGGNNGPGSAVNNDGTPPPVDGSYCQASTLTCWANFTQDMATTLNFFFGGLEIVIVTGACFAGPEGCGAGLLLSWEIFNAGPNQLESALSGTSLLLTGLEDYSTDNIFGESTETSFVTFVAGGISPDPIADTIIDGYASGYNHGFFNGISTIISGGPFFQSPGSYK
jgi:hypothetical protein